MTAKRIGIIGAGNMAEALIKGLLRSGFAGPLQILASDIREERLDWIHRTYGVEVERENGAVVRKAETLVLAVKPQDVGKVLQGITGTVGPDHLLISIAAGIPLEFIEKRLPGEIRLIRTMPNTPALVQQGCTAIAMGRHARPQDLETAQGIFGSVGRVVVVDEKWMDAVTALSGSGPAYGLLIIEALTEGGVRMGLSRDVARILTVQTLLGTILLLNETQNHPAVLKEMVTSPGGTTSAGLYELEKGGIRALLMKAVEAATLRSQELGRLMS